jgi:hypothetical protein
VPSKVETSGQAPSSSSFALVDGGAGAVEGEVAAAALADVFVGVAADALAAVVAHELVAAEVGAALLVLDVLEEEGLAGGVEGEALAVVAQAVGGLLEAVEAGAVVFGRAAEGALLVGGAGDVGALVGGGGLDGVGEGAGGEVVGAAGDGGLVDEGADLVRVGGAEGGGAAGRGAAGVEAFGVEALEEGLLLLTLDRVLAADDGRPSSPG